MADRIITRKPEITEPPTKKTKPKKRRWPWILLGTVILALLAFIVYFAIQLVMVISSFLEEVAETPEIAVAAPAEEVVPATEPVVVAEPPVVETTVPAQTMTTVPEVTTLPIVDREELGLLEEVHKGASDQAHISGVVLAVESEQVAIQEEGTVTVRDAWILLVDLGDHPKTGEAIVGRLILAVQDHSTMNMTFYCRGFAGGTNCNTAFEEEVVSLLDVGRRYNFFVEMELYCEELPAEFQELCPQLKDDIAALHAYNRELVAALKGGEMPGSDEQGIMHLVEIPLGATIP